MKEIKAFVRPERLSEIVAQLRKEGFCCLSVFEGEGTGHYTDRKKEWPSLDHPFLHSKIAKIEMVISPEKAERVIRIIHEHGKTGYPGDGLIYMADVTKAVRVKDLSVEKLQMHKMM